MHCLPNDGRQFIHRAITVLLLVSTAACSNILRELFDFGYQRAIDGDAWSELDLGSIEGVETRQPGARLPPLTVGS